MEILNLICRRLKYYRDCFADVLPELMNDPKLTKAYLPAFQNDIDFIDEVARLCSARDYSALTRQLKDYSAVRLGVVKNAEISDELSAAKELRDEFKKEREKLAAKFCSLNAEQIRRNQLDTAAVLRKLHTLLTLFGNRFAAEKRKRSLVDFNDLERMAARLLIGSDGQPTEIALSTASHYYEIYIDEYQDVNSLQDSIFTAVSHNNRFMVGDVKQSIYAFRGAEPDIFQSYRGEFARADDDEAPPAKGRTVFLSDNFRCDKPVIEFANLVSQRIFTNGSGSLPYYPEDDLVHSKNASELGTPVQLRLIDGSEGEDDDPDDVSLREAEYIASEIKKLLKDGVKSDGKPIKPSDIAILMRSAKAHSDAFAEVFERESIPFYNNVSGDFFENAEILLALCLLNVIDNPTRDIYLAGLLKSPLYGFTLDELILIRRHTSDGSLYDALRAYTADKKFAKGERFLSALAEYRRRAEGLPVDKLIWYLYTDTGLPALVYGGDDQQSKRRRANLTLLYEYARRFEASSFKGLYNFIRYINDILENKAQLETAKIYGDSSETVKLMTIHQSKGLEFTVVFLCGCGKRFNEADLKANIVVERSLGIAPKLADSTGFARYDTPVRQAIAKKLADSQLDEEMRVLYVALTRAKERLYVTGMVKEPQKLLDKAYNEAPRLSRSLIMRNGGYLRWMLLAAANYELTAGEKPYEIEIIPAKTETDEICAPTDPAANADETFSASDSPLEDFRRLVSERFDFAYPRSRAAKLPAKLSVSDLYPTVLDDDGSAKLESEPDQPITAKVPLFLSADADSSASASERGTATHLFMQFCDFSFFDRRSPEELPALVSDECARLLERRFITPRIASLINQRQLVRFFKSRVFAEICASPRVYREHRFNVRLAAGDFTADPTLADELRGEAILVQGVIDCFWENPDGSLTLLDYKTDFIPRDMPRAEAERMLLDRHRLQLSYYRAACARVSAKKIARTLIFSFGLGYEIELI